MGYNNYYSNRKNNQSKDGSWKPKNSDGDKGTDYKPKTFARSFYYINFLDKSGHYDSSQSELFEGDKQHAMNKARWYTRNTWALTQIPYQVVAIGVYDSHRGHVHTYELC